MVLFYQAMIPLAFLNAILTSIRIQQDYAKVNFNFNKCFKTVLKAVILVQTPKLAPRVLLDIIS